MTALPPAVSADGAVSPDIPPSPSLAVCATTVSSRISFEAQIPPSGPPQHLPLLPATVAGLGLFPAPAPGSAPTLSLSVGCGAGGGGATTRLR